MRAKASTPDARFLTRALDLACAGSAAGDGGPFGALVVRDGEIIGEGWNRVLASHDPTAHAEILAIRAACAHLAHHHLEGCVLYASSEPCPLCLSAAYWARIARIVYANPRAEAAAAGFCDDQLYGELCAASAQRALPCTHSPIANADRPFREWLLLPQRTIY